MNLYKAATAGDCSILASHFLLELLQHEGMARSWPDTNTMLLDLQAFRTLNSNQMLFFFLKDKFSLCSTDCPGTHSPCRPGWAWIHRDPLVSVSQVLGLKAHYGQFKFVLHLFLLFYECFACTFVHHIVLGAQGGSEPPCGHWDIKPRFFATARNTLNHRASSPALISIALSTNTSISRTSKLLN